MDVLVAVSLLVLAAAVVVLGVVLTGIASEIKRTRRAVEKLSLPAVQPATHAAVSMENSQVA